MTLFSWFTGIGSFVGLVTGIIGAFKAFMDDRPFSYVEPDQLDGVLKLHIVNAGKRSIFIAACSVWPAKHWYIAPNALPMTRKGSQESRYGKREARSSRLDQNVIIEPGKKHEFFVGPHDGDEGPIRCFILTSWQPLGGLPVPRFPLPLLKSKSQVQRLFLARKDTHDK
ncbi:MAG TPA: hypothetical protein VH684_16680 [Xanthobacteraceae bacterium]|jgi:hypothetical protein